MSFRTGRLHRVVADSKRLASEELAKPDPSRNGIYTIRSSDGGGLTRMTSDPEATISQATTRPKVSASYRRVSVEMRNSLWVVHSDGSGLHEIRIQSEPACGGPIADPTSRGCIHPRWSPDGKKIILGIATAAATGETENNGEIEKTYTVNADGTGLTQVTKGPEDEAPDWAAYPLIP